MKNASFEHFSRIIFAILVFCASDIANAQLTFSSIVVFGTSLSDPGNAFTLLAHPVAGLNLDSNVSQNLPPYDTLDESLIPSAPYAKGGHHFSNGATWIEQFAQGRGLAAYVGPAFQSNSKKARNYAVGGARATNFPDRVNLPQQVETFLNDVNHVAPADALYVIEIGNNDIRDALVMLSTTGDIFAANNILTLALQGIAENIQVLHTFGARKFLVWNAARIDLVPAVRALGSQAEAAAKQLTDGFNFGLANNVLPSISAIPGLQVAQLDIASKMAAIISSPSNFGLSNVTSPCVNKPSTPPSPPFTCQQPDNYFFWDGIHPTKAVHSIISQLAIDVLASYPSP